MVGDAIMQSGKIAVAAEILSMAAGKKEFDVANVLASMASTLTNTALAKVAPNELTKTTLSNLSTTAIDSVAHNNFQVETLAANLLGSAMQYGAQKGIEELSPHYQAALNGETVDKSSLDKAQRNPGNKLPGSRNNLPSRSAPHHVATYHDDPLLDADFNKLLDPRINVNNPRNANALGNGVAEVNRQNYLQSHAQTPSSSTYNRVKGFLEDHPRVTNFFQQHPSVLNALESVGNLGHTAPVLDVYNNPLHAINYTPQRLGTKALAYAGARLLGKFGGLWDTESQPSISMTHRDYLNQKFGRTDDLHLDISKRGYLESLKQFDLPTKIDSKIFYSGTANNLKADIFARMTDKTTIDRLPMGVWLKNQALYRKFEQDFADDIWKAASRQYAASARGEVYVFANGASPARIFNTVELPALQSNPLVTGINYLDHPYLDFEHTLQPRLSY